MTGLIRPFGKRNSKFIHPDEARRRLDEIVVEEEGGEPLPAADRKKSELLILNSETYYDIRGVLFGGAQRQVIVEKNLIDSGRAHTLQEWKDFSDTLPNGAKIPSLPLYSALAQALCDDHEMQHLPPGEVRDGQLTMLGNIVQMLKEDFERGAMTSTVLTHVDENRDEVAHDYFSASHKGAADTPGNREFIFYPMNRAFDDMSKEDARILTGSSNPTDLRIAYKFISGRHSYVHTDRSQEDPTLRPIIALAEEHLEFTSYDTNHQRRCARAIYVTTH